MKLSFISLKITKDRVLDLAIETTYLLVVFLVPIWFAYLFPGFNMFELSKLAVFRFLVWFLLALTAFRISSVLLVSKGVIFKLAKLFFIPALFVVGLAVSLFFSLDWQQSFFGSYDRQEGWVSQATYLLWSFLLAINLLRPVRSGSSLELSDSIVRKRVIRLVLTMVISTAIVALYGVLQIMGFDFLDWPEQPYLTGRTLSFLGQPNFLASFLLLGIPLTAYFVYASQKFYLRSLFFILVLLQIACLFFTASRGGLLAFLAALALFAGYLFFSARLSKKIKMFFVAAALFLGIASLAALELVTPGRIQESFDFTRGSFASRVFFFQAAADAILERPFFGYGLENGGEVFIKYYERDWGIYGDVSANTDRAHNIFLDILISAGFLGLCLLVIFYYYYFRLNWQEIRAGRERALSMALFLGASSYLISLFFSFAIAAGEVYFWSFLAVLFVLFASRQVLPLKITPTKASKLLKILGVLVSLVLIAISVWQMKRSTHVLMADYYKNRIFIAVDSREFIEAAVLYSEISSLKINPVLQENYDYYLGAQLVNYCLYGNFQDLAEEAIIKNKLQIIFNSLPDNGYENILVKANIAACLNNSAEADKYFNLLETLAPEWPRGYLERGYYLIKQGDLLAAEKYYQLADLNLPDPDSDKINAPHRRIVANYKFLIYNSLAEAYFQKGNFERAGMFFQAAYRYHPEDYSLFKKIADCYYLQGDLSQAIKYVRRGLASNPVDASWHIALAALYLENNDIEEARAQLTEAEKIAPADMLPEIEKLKEKF